MKFNSTTIGMIHDYALRRFRSGWLGGFAAFLFVIACSVAQAQTCPPDPGGGYRITGLDYTGGNTTNLYPQSVPSGQSGVGQATIGRLQAATAVASVYASNVVTIRPVLTNGKTGSVALYYKTLNFRDAPNAVLRIYQGTTATGTPAVTINASNASSFPGTSFTYAGPVTVQFVSPTPGTTGNFDIVMRYSTGDQVFDSSFGRKVAAWTDFIQANSYTFVDDHRGTPLGSTYSDNWNPISIAYFDANKKFVSADMSYCVDSHYDNVGSGFGDYPGRTNFTSYINYDIDRSGTIDGTDQLKMARLGWYLANVSVPLTELRGVQDVVWSIVNYGYGGGSETAVPSLPSPAEPTFSITAPASVVSGKPAAFTVNFANSGSGANRLKLIVPAGVTIGTVTGATYSGGFLNFASASGTATIQATSASVQTAQLQVQYAETDYWNVNVKVYHPCDNGAAKPRQDFVGASQGAVLYPHREASVTWTAPSPLTCANGYYFLDNGTSLYRITSGDTRSFITTVSGDLNAMGYSPIDNFLWGYNRATNQVFKLGSDGAEYYTIPNLPAPVSSTSTTVGTVDLNGYLYLYQPNTTQYFTIDVNPARGTYLQLVDPTASYTAKSGAPWGTATTARNISDWAFNPNNGLIQAVVNGAGPDAYYVMQLNPVTGVSTLSGTAVSGGSITAAPTSEVIDSQYFNSNGNLMVYLSAFWYEINLSTNIATRVSTTKAPISFGNDAASCVQAIPLTSFVCSPVYYQVETDKLYSYDDTGARSLVANLSGNLNAIGYSTVDNLLWGFDNASAQVFQLGANGVMQRFTIPNMPAATQPDGYSVGTVSTTGYLYLYEKGAASYITIDISPSRAATYLKIVDPTASFAAKSAAPWGTALSGGAVGISDWAYNAADSRIYALTDGSSATPYQVFQLNPLTGATTLLPGQVNGGGIQTSGQNFGSAFIDANGSFKVFGNTTGYLYQVNIATKTATQVTTVANPSASSDGAFCPQASSALPVTLVNFTATAEQASVNLNWTTASEINNSGFEIQRSANTNQWKSLGFVKSNVASGNTQLRQTYRFTDSAPLDGTNYYRLRQVDLDGNSSHSPVRSVSIENALTRITVYPNPVRDQLTVKGLSGLETIEVQDLSGRSVAQSRNEAGQSEKTFPVKSLLNGMYIITIHTLDGKSVSHKMVKTN